MDTLSLPKGLMPHARGVAHGEHFRSKIREITQIRLALALSQGRFATSREVVEAARLHLPVLERFDPPLHAELVGIAAGAELDPAEIVVLNHYTDLKDIDSARVAAQSGPPSRNEDEDCSTVIAKTPDGIMLAQTWDMHGSAEPYVCMIEVPSDDGQPGSWTFTITGCLALAGMNESGVGVAINNLKSTDARVGVVWPALVRRMLREFDAEGSKRVLMAASMSSGHHYAIADDKRAFGIETSGSRKRVVFEATFAETPQIAFVHTNHCLDPEVASVSWVADESTSHERFDRLAESAQARPILGRHDLWERLGSHDGYPRSVCTHLADADNPHAMKTCGAILMDPSRYEVWSHAGCIHGATPRTYRFGP